MGDEMAAPKPLPEPKHDAIIKQVVREDGSTFTIYRNGGKADEPQYIGPFADCYYKDEDSLHRG